MLAGVFEGEGKLSIKEVPDPKITKPDEVLVKVELAGICGTDVHILEVPPGHPATAGTILGHEYVGTVIDKGVDVKTVNIGDRVVVDPNLTCGICRYCRRGLPNMCENFTTLGIYLNGGFAPYNVAPAKALYKISKDVPLERSALAEPLSCVANAIRKINLQVGDNVVLIGAGPMGLLFLLMIKAQGVGKTIVIEPTPFRAKIAKDLGADIVLNPKEVKIKEAIMDLTELGADIVIDAVGSQFATALDLVKRNGTVLLFGMNENALPQIKQFSITRYELKILGSYISWFSFPQTVAILESGNVPVEKLVTHKLPLEKLQEGIEIMKRGEGIKILINP
ncbi:MAG: zinc-dependent alcohol dehydrogenase family protein [bacterium]|nr:zinc-dependent alcohol dehydrogenase family protein [bacterium]